MNYGANGQKTLLLAPIKQAVEIMILYEFKALHSMTQEHHFTVSESRGPVVSVCVCVCGAKYPAV